jgi:adenosylcobinamide-GDP ribazoletransferase
VTYILLRPPAALGVTAGAILAACCVSALAWQQIGGQTGDVLGATEIAVECIVLATLTLNTLQG